MKILETIRQKARTWLGEDLDPFRKWKVNWTEVKKESDDSNFIRKEKLAKSFEAWERNPIAESGIEYKVTYILGKGLQYTVEHPDIERALNRFWQENNMPMLHVELVRSLFVDGELFLYFPKTEIGQNPVLVPIDASEIEYIARDPENFRNVAYYHRKYKAYNYPSFEENSSLAVLSYEERHENILSEDIIHFKLGSLLNLSRGRGVLFRIHEYLDEFTAWLKIRKMLHKAKGAFAWIFKVGTDSQTTVDEWQTRLNNFAKYDSDGNLLDAIPTGQPIVIGKSMDITTPSPNIGASGAFEDGRQLRMMAAVGMRLPEYMLSDGENANLATTQSQESPMVRCMEADQEKVRLLFLQIFDKVLDMLIQVGDLQEEYEIETVKPDGTSETVSRPTKELYDLIFPEIATSDISELAGPIQQLITHKVLSRETACTLLGYDWEQEKERIKQEEKEGFISIPKLPGMFGPMIESMDLDDVKNVTKLRQDCQKELRENYDQYKENLIAGVPEAKEVFIDKHQEIVRKYLENGAKEPYANRVLRTAES